MSPRNAVLVRSLLAIAGIGLAAGGTVHALAFSAARVAADKSAMTGFFGSAFKGLWLSDSGTTLALALVVLLIAVEPRATTRGVIVALGLLPLMSAAAIYATIGNFFAGHLMLAIGVLTVTAGLLNARASAGGN